MGRTNFIKDKFKGDTLMAMQQPFLCPIFIVMYYPKKSFKDKTGLIFGRLTVIGYDPELSWAKHLYWKCKCECGNITSKLGNNLLVGYAKSCGCLFEEQQNIFKSGDGARKHGATKTTEYTIWEGINR